MQRNKKRKIKGERKLPRRFMDTWC